ncbi:PREDICTED: protein transport protein Sec16B [Cyprinodon variegatus]|uniref:protein transport protein Sec16B n=1 Tax=Cyprinodon variegatus TaxID=28743 RepID=UPI0007427F5F|nr:PREDICTED: protein transport protein Sec16B [Cyprinodon variegatus]
MDRRGQQLPDPSHRKQDKEHYSRFTQQEWDMQYPPPDPRDRGPHWSRPDAHYMPAFPGPPRAQLFPYTSQDYAYNYGWQEHHRPQSRYEQRRDNSKHHFSDYKDIEEISSNWPGTLESSKTSGLSSSSYELSQYMNGSDLCDPDIQPPFITDGGHPAVHQISAPMKYSTPHAVVSFGPAGQLIRVSPAQEKLSQLEIHSLEVLLSETPEQQEMRNFPGPLTREDLHKVDAIEFAHQQAGACMSSGLHVASGSSCFSHCFPCGEQEALESAMTSGLWGHALFLASKMGSRSYTTVLSRFTSQLVASDPLQTLFQLLSGRIPAASMCCGNEKWGDWRPHLAVMLSNETGDPAVQQKAILTMGDSLASRGLIHAAHVCYLTAGASFGVFLQKAERLVLLGSSHRQCFGNFASNSAIQCTELYEYCQTLGGKSFSIPFFQVYKLLYASRLLDCGLWSQAFHYCEVVGQAVLRQTEPHYVLTEQVIKLSDRLRFSEGQYGDAVFGGAAQEPEWLKQLRTRHQRLQMGIYDQGDINDVASQSHVSAHDDCQLYPESDLDDLSCKEDPEPELLYFRGSEQQDPLIHGTGEETGEPSVMNTQTQHRPHANTPFMPTMVAETPTVPMSQNISHHYTDGVEVRSSPPHCALSNLSLAAAEADAYSEPGTDMNDQMLEVNTSHDQSQQVITGPSEETEGPKEAPKQSAKTGWFSSWFKSKPKEAQKNDIPAQTDPLPPVSHHPPPPGTFPPSLSPAGVNPFSRKAGQQPR